MTAVALYPWMTLNGCHGSTWANLLEFMEAGVRHRQVCRDRLSLQNMLSGRTMAGPDARRAGDDVC